MQIILGLLDEALALTGLKTVMSSFLHISPTLALASVTCFVFLYSHSLKQRLITTVPVSLAVYSMYIRCSVNGTLHIQVSPLCWSLYALYIEGVSHAGKDFSFISAWLSDAYKSIMPNGNQLPLGPGELSVWVHTVWKTQTILWETKAELKHNLNEEARKGHTGIKNCHTLLIF